MGQTIRFCEATDEVRLAYAVHGQGPPLVKAANWVTHVEFDWDSPLWRPWWDELGRHHTVIRYDERGCGLSDRDPEGCRRCNSRSLLLAVLLFSLAVCIVHQGSPGESARAGTSKVD